MRNKKENGRIENSKRKKNLNLVSSMKERFLHEIKIGFLSHFCDDPEQKEVDK